VVDSFLPQISLQLWNTHNVNRCQTRLTRGKRNRINGDSAGKCVEITRKGDRNYTCLKTLLLHYPLSHEHIGCVFSFLKDGKWAYELISKSIRHPRKETETRCSKLSICLPFLSHNKYFLVYSENIHSCSTDFQFWKFCVYNVMFIFFFIWVV
jgi:hypothetical protein